MIKNEKLKELASDLMDFGSGAESSIYWFLEEYTDPDDPFSFYPPISDCIKIIDCCIQDLYKLRKKFRELQEEIKEE